MQAPIPSILVGCGAISRAWLGAIAGRDDVRVISLVDLDENRARARRDEFALPSACVGADLGAMLADVRPAVVFDCTVPDAHADVACTALAAGCHVLAEKPMAASMDEAARILEAARESGKIHAVVQQRRYLDPIRRLTRLVASGAIGAPAALHADFFIAPHFGGFRDEMAHVLLLDMAIHTFDQARFITGADPVAVLCHEWNPAGSWYRHGASGTCTFRMTGGLVFTYRGSWCAEGLPTSWEGSWRAIGARGTATWDGEETIRAERVVEDATPDGALLRETEAVAIPELEPLEDTGHAGVINEFLRCVRTGETPQTCGADNIRSLAMVHAAIRSAETGGWVDVLSA